MKKMKLFIDTHSQKEGTFPEGLTKAQFAEFYQKYVEICEEEGVVSLRTHVGIGDGKAFCFNMAQDEAAVKRVHERAGLPYDSITEVKTATPGDILFS